MISYETAKKLKEAGFPQEDRHWYWVDFTFPSTLWCINALEAKKLHEEYECMTAAPTLSELIEACPKFIYCKNWETDCNFELWAEKDGWLAVYHWIDGTTHDEIENARGSTPEEAVANLWLSLQTKEK